MRGPTRDGKNTEYTVVEFNVPYCVYGVNTINDEFGVDANATHENGGKKWSVLQVNQPDLHWIVVDTMATDLFDGAFTLYLYLYFTYG